MITKTAAFQTSDGKTHTSLDMAQLHELELLPAQVDNKPISVGQWAILNREKILDILTTTPSSKPRARSINGGRKKRKATTDPAAVNRELQDGKQ